MISDDHRVFLIVKGERKKAQATLYSYPLKAKKSLPDTLFTGFLKEKIEHYVEPQRMGTPKGEPIGTFRDKFNASLLMLTNIPQKEISKNLGISFGVLRKWNTEDNFKDLIEEHCNEFVDRVIRYVEGKIGAAIKPKLQATLYEEPTKPIKEGKFKYPKLELDKLKDSYLFGECILEGIRDKVYAIIDREPLPKERKEVDRALLLQGVLVTYFFESGQPPSKMFREIKKSYAKRMILRLRNIYNSSLDEREKPEAELILSTLEKYIDGTG